MPGDYDIEYASPWAGANYFPVGKPGTVLQRFEKATWTELDRICREVPEAGIHYQMTQIYARKKDAGTATGQWFEELTKEDAWFKDVVPNVCSFLFISLPSFSLSLSLSSFVLVTSSDVFSVPCLTKVGTTKGLRLWHRIYLCMHQHGHLPPLDGGSMCQGRCHLQARHPLPHL